VLEVRRVVNGARANTALSACDRGRADALRASREPWEPVPRYANRPHRRETEPRARAHARVGRAQSA
jgi:hypothetical protein